MSITEQFTPQTIGCALGVGIVIFYAVRGFWAWCDRNDAERAKRNPPVPDQAPIAADHVAKRQPASQRASSRLVGGLLQRDEEPAPTIVNLVKARYTIVQSGLQPNHREAALVQEAAIQRQMAVDTSKGKRP